MRSTVDGLAAGPSTVISATRPSPSRQALDRSRGRSPVSAGDDNASRTVADARRIDHGERSALRQRRERLRAHQVTDDVATVDGRRLASIRQAPRCSRIAFGTAMA